MSILMCRNHLSIQWYCHEWNIQAWHSLAYHVRCSIDFNLPWTLLHVGYSRPGYTTISLVIFTARMSNVWRFSLSVASIWSSSIVSLNTSSSIISYIESRQWLWSGSTTVFVVGLFVVGLPRTYHYIDNRQPCISSFGCTRLQHFSPAVTMPKSLSAFKRNFETELFAQSYISSPRWKKVAIPGFWVIICVQKIFKKRISQYLFFIFL